MKAAKASGRSRGLYVLELMAVVTVMLPFLLMCVGLFDYYRKSHQFSALVRRYADENGTKLLRLRTGDQVYTVYVRADNYGGCDDTDNFPDSLTKVARRFLADLNELNFCSDHAPGCSPEDVGLQVQVYSSLISEIDSHTSALERKPEGHTSQNAQPVGRCSETSEGIKLGYLWRYYGALEKSIRPETTKFVTDNAPIFSVPTSTYSAKSRQNYGVTTIVDDHIEIIHPDPRGTPVPRNFVRHAPVFVVGAAVDVRKTFAGRAMCTLAAAKDEHDIMDCWGSAPPPRRLTKISMGLPRKLF